MGRVINKFFTTDNHGQNIWNKVKKSSKINEEQKTLITASVQFLIAITKVLFPEGRVGSISTQF